MNNALTLELEKNNLLELNTQSKGILENISDAFQKSVDKGLDLLPLPEKYESIIRDGVKRVDLKTMGFEAAETALKVGMRALGMKVNTFNNLKELGEAIKAGDLKKGLSSVLNIGINSIKGLPTDVKKLIQSGKDVILGNTFDDELKKVMTKQKNTISRLDKKCNQFEEAISKNDTKEMTKIIKSIKQDLEKVAPIQNVIERAEKIVNQYELSKSKGTTELTKTEIELCNMLTK